MDLGGRILWNAWWSPRVEELSPGHSNWRDRRSAAPVVIASGGLTRRADAGAAPLYFDFSERFARRLKLTVIDDRNAPLPISGITAMSVARQVVFEPGPWPPLPSAYTTAAPEPGAALRSNLQASRGS